MMDANYRRASTSIEFWYFLVIGESVDPCPVSGNVRISSAVDVELRGVVSRRIFGEEVRDGVLLVISLCKATTEASAGCDSAFEG